MTWRQKENYYKQEEYHVNFRLINLEPKYFQEEFGKCLIDIPKPNLFVYLLKELTAPFYIL